MIRSASSTDRALELLAEHDRALVADASQAAAVALARQSVAAEYDALIDSIALAFWPVITRARAVELALAAAQTRALCGPNTVGEATLADESFLLFYAAEKG
jgi:hypothetical protein